MGAAHRRTCWSRRMSKYPQFEITADDVFRAAAELDFEFFADLIRSTVGRCTTNGKKVKTEELSAFAPVALAGLRSLPDTLASRAIHTDATQGT